MADIENQLKELEKLIRRAKRAAERAQKLENDVFNVLDDMCIDLYTPSQAENADNLGEAVSCYLSYGEFGLTNVMREIGEACHDG